MKEIRYIFSTASILAFVISFVFVYLYFIEDETKYNITYFIISLFMMIIGEVFILITPSKHEVNKWNKEHNK